MKFVITIIFLFIFNLTVCSEELTFAFSKIPEEINLNDNNPSLIENLLLQASVASLFGRFGISDINSGSLINTLAKNSESTKFYLTLKSNLLFSNGQMILLSDVNHSLSLCKEFRTINVIKTKMLSDLELLIEVKASLENSIINKVLSVCKIFPREIALAFGNDFGKNTSFISKAYYYINQFVPSKRIVLVNYSKDLNINNSPRRINFLAYRTANQGLARLRAGGIDILITDDSAVKEKAVKDETLNIEVCNTIEYIVRKSLNFKCENTLHFEKLYYKK